MPEDKNKKKESSKDSKSLARKAISTPNKKKVQDYNDSLKSYNSTKIYENKFPIVSNEVSDKITGLVTTPNQFGLMPIGWYKKPDVIGPSFSPAYKKPVQPYVLEKEKPKITPVKQEIIKKNLTPTGTVKLPTDSDISIKVEKRGGKFAVDYFDVDEKSNLVPKTEIFDTADEADSFVKKRKDEGKFYGPSMTRRGVDSDVAKKVASKSSYSQYRKLGTGKEK
jgi:hypothetical protein